MIYRWLDASPSPISPSNEGEKPRRGKIADGMYRPLFFVSLGAATAVVLALATAHELTRFRPEVELRRAFTALAKAETVRQVSGFGWTDGGGDSRTVSTMYLSGQARASDASHGTRFRLVRLGKTQYNDMAGEWRTVDGTDYLTYAAPGPVVEGTPFAKEGTWLSFGPDEFAAWGPLLPGVPMPVSLLFDQRASPWTRDSLLRARRLLAQADFSRVSFDGKTEDVNGVKARVLDARPDREALVGFLLGIVRAREGREPGDTERLRAAELAAGLARFTFRVWVGEKDHVPVRVQTAGLWTADDGRQVPVDFLAELSGLNDPFGVEVPASPLAFRTVLRSLFGTLPSAGDRVSAAASFTKPASLPVFVFTNANDTDGDGLDVVLETFYGTDPRVQDTDGDGMNDGNEVRAGRNPRGAGSLFGFGLGAR